MRNLVFVRVKVVFVIPYTRKRRLWDEMVKVVLTYYKKLFWRGVAKSRNVGGGKRNACLEWGVRLGGKIQPLPTKKK